MKITLKYFGKIQEVAGMEEEVLEIEKNSNSENVIHLLQKKYPALKSTNYSVAVNQTIWNEKRALREADELALLPPFAGG